MRSWCGYLSEAKCTLFAYGLADATAIPKPHHLLPDLNPDFFIFLVPAYLGCSGKEAVKRCSSSSSSRPPCSSLFPVENGTLCKTGENFGFIFKVGVHAAVL